MKNEELNKASLNVTVSLIISFTSLIIASKNQPDNPGLGGLVIFIFQPMIFILTIISFFSFRSFEPLKKYSFVITIVGAVFSILYALYGYLDI